MHFCTQREYTANDSLCMRAHCMTCDVVARHCTYTHTSRSSDHCSMLVPAPLRTHFFVVVIFKWMQCMRYTNLYLYFYIFITCNERRVNAVHFMHSRLAHRHNVKFASVTWIQIVYDSSTGRTMLSHLQKLNCLMRFNLATESGIYMRFMKRPHFFFCLASIFLIAWNIRGVCEMPRS